jgi:TonB-linked SusC/RagA family outer membrane protein
MKMSFRKNYFRLSLQQDQLLKKIMRYAWQIAFLVFLTTQVFAQNTIRVKGRVTNETNEPVARASVTVKGTFNGVTANDNGDYEITAPANGTLVISAVNFTQQEVRINNRQTVNVTLESLAKTESEVVVVGYGTQKSKDVTGAVVKLRGETLREVPAPNIIAQLKGRTAGVDIVSNSATPGGSGSIRIRGNRTLATSQGAADQIDAPLVVLDGIPYSGSINDINTEDVASLEILKDASATAIYGSRGAGGVIIITTKRGKPGKSIMSYDGYHGITSVMDKLNVFNGPEYAQFKADAATYNRTGPGTSSYLLTAAEQAALAAGISTDWQDLIYKQGFVTSHQLGITGGHEGTQFGLSGGYYKETGIIPNQDYERYSLRATIDQQVNKRIKFGLNTLNTLSYSNTPGGAGVTSGLMRLTPLAAPYNTDGTVNLTPAFGSIDAATISPLTLITKASSILARNRRLRTFNSLYGEVNIINGLKYRINVGLDYSQAAGNGYNGPSTWTNSNTSQANSNANTNNTEAWTYTIENLLLYEKTIKEKHKIGFTGLFSVQKDHNQSSTYSVTGVPADYILNSNFSLASGVITGSGNFFERGLVSYMARVNYGYDNRYLLTATVRRDGSSVLSPGNQYFTYPAFSLGWNAMNEKFMNGISFLSNLKVRGGWGRTSNQGINPYSTLGLLSSGTNFTYNFGQSPAGQQAGYLVTTLANNSLRWQSTGQWNVGLDFGIFKNRLTGSIDVYGQKTKDILLPFLLPQSNGAGSTIKNLGKTKGNGLEINLSSVNVQTRSGLTWTTDVNFYFNREKVVFLTAPGQLVDIADGWFVGQPLTVIYDVKKIGIWQTDDSTKGILAQQTSPVQFPGQIRIVDLNGDHKIDQNDRQVLGNFQPQWEGGMTNRVAYKGFDFSLVIFARMGMKVLVPYVTDDGGAQGYPFFMQGRVNQLKINYWTRSNPTNEFPAPDAGTDRFPFGSTLAYMDGSFIKCRSINLGYMIPSRILNKAGINSLRVYVNVTNPFIIYSPFVRDGFGPDPEGNGYGGSVTSPLAGSSIGAGGSNGQGRQISVNANNPSVRQFIIGLNLKF